MLRLGSGIILIIARFIWILQGFDVAFAPQSFVTGSSIFDHRRALRPGGICVMVGGSTAAILQTVFLGPLVSMIGSKKTGILMHKPNQKDLVYLNELLETGKVVPVIDRRYPLSEVARALRRFGEGHVKGKVVITA